MGFFDDIGRSINNAVNQIGRSVGNATGIRYDPVNDLNKWLERPLEELADSDIGKGLTGVGSIGYLNPITGGARVLMDLARADRKKADARAQEDEARRVEGESRRTLEDVQAQQRGIAEQFRKSRPDLEKGLLSNVETAARRDLAGNLQNIKEGAARRGILRSGITQMGRAQAGADFAQDLTQRRSAVKEDLEKTQREFDYAPIKTGLETAGQDIVNANQAYKSALEAMMQRNQALQELGRAGGQAAGMYFANRTKGS